MYDIIIVGGNLVGASCALYLAKLRPNFKIGIIESRELEFDNNDILDSRIYAISPHNHQILRALDAWPQAKFVNQIIQMNVCGDANSNIILDAIAAKRGYLAKVIESKQLLKSIYQQIKLHDNIQIIHATLTSVISENNSTKLIADNNDAYECRLCVAADGANSFIRSQFDFEQSEIAYGQSGVVANFTCEFSHNDIAYQWFLPNGDILAYLPLPGKRISIVWSSNDPQSLLSLNEHEFCEKVAATGQFKLGKLALITPPAAFPLRLTLIERLYTHGIVLIGDAAHTIHPLAGLGVNLGFADVWVLAEILSKYKHYQLNDVAILAKYNDERLTKIRKTQLVCHSLHGLFGANKSSLAFLRNKGLNLVNQATWLKNALIREVVAN